MSIELDVPQDLPGSSRSALLSINGPEPSFGAATTPLFCIRSNRGRNGLRLRGPGLLIAFVSIVFMVGRAVKIPEEVEVWSPPKNYRLLFPAVGETGFAYRFSLVLQCHPTLAQFLAGTVEFNVIRNRAVTWELLNMKLSVHLLQATNATYSSRMRTEV